MPNQRQPEPPIDPPAPSADEEYRAKCFGDLLACVNEIVPLAEKIVVTDMNRHAVTDAGTYCVVDSMATVLRDVVIRWCEGTR